MVFMGDMAAAFVGVLALMVVFRVSSAWIVDKTVLSQIILPAAYAWAAVSIINAIGASDGDGYRVGYYLFLRAPQVLVASWFFVWLDYRGKPILDD